MSMLETTTGQTRGRTAKSTTETDGLRRADPSADARSAAAVAASTAAIPATTAATTATTAGGNA
ncbi:hypothetical protein [Haloterrigena alkaliphila]|uniref:hypothetical protein n=1 Tax=Haloterrigena alkaliphila TaxID=2816475 RepID=UPI001CFF93E3|nr:hypothetical protein [Haloterrigena alkaliphila]UHQ95023.1 hypothetical protein J0X25_18895 [Haloterrigena alkaliphila]